MNQNEAMKDQYIDLMIKLALDMQEQKEVDAVEQSDLKPIELAAKQSAQNAFNNAYERIDRDNRTNKRKNVLFIASQCPRLMLKAAACIALVIVIAAPIAFAQSPVFRSKVMELLIQFDHAQGTVTFSYEENEDASFFVPVGWTGTHFLSYIPEGLEVHEFDPQYQVIEYRDTNNNRLLSYGEHDEETVVMMGTDGADVSYIEILGQTACVIESTSTFDDLPVVSITWANNENWFDIYTFGIGKEETLKIAKAVKMIK